MSLACDLPSHAPFPLPPPPFPLNRLRAIPFLVLSQHVSLAGGTEVTAGLLGRLVPAEPSLFLLSLLGLLGFYSSFSSNLLWLYPADSSVRMQVSCGFKVAPCSRSYGTRRVSILELGWLRLGVGCGVLGFWQDRDSAQRRDPPDDSAVET